MSERAKVDAVCTTQQARDYFESKGLTYDDITEGDILALVMMLNKEIKKASKAGEMSTNPIYLSRRVDMKKKKSGTIISCFLYMNSHYFTQRECISFNQNGFIGFCGWVDQGNKKPVMRAFLKWCDYLAKEKEDDNDEQN